MPARLLHKIKDHPTLRKDPSTGAVLNVDVNALRRHEHREAGKQKELQRDAAIIELRSDIQSIKNMLSELLRGRG